MIDTQESPDAVALAVSTIATAEATVKVTTGTQPGAAKLPPVKLDRLSVERRVLGHITDEVEFTALGARNTLAALTYSLMRDRNTTHAPEPNPSMEIDGKSLSEIAATVHKHLQTLVGHGLAAQRDDGSYALTVAGQVELSH